MSIEDLSPGTKAAVLAEALPYIKRFHGKTIVVKYALKILKVQFTV